MNFSKYNQKLEGANIILEPKSSHTHSLIWLHGLGDSANGFQAIFNESPLNPLTDTTKIVLLTAPIRKVTINMGMKMTSWFDFKSMQVDESNFTSAIGVDQILDSAKIIEAYVKKEIDLLKDSKKVFIGGFSQGACMSMHVGLQYPQTLGGIFVYSGFRFPIIKDSKQNENTELLISHGQLDPLLPWNDSKQTYEQFDTQAHQIRFEIFDDLDHGLGEKSFKIFKEQFSAWTK